MSGMGAVTVTLNGQRRTVDAAATVADIVAMLGRDPARPGVAVAVNGTVVPRSAWPHWQCGSGDRIEVLSAVQGG